MKSLFLMVILLSVKSGALPDLKKELNHAKKELSRAQNWVMTLEEAIAQKEIQRIEEEIAHVEPNGSSSDFSAERELLTAIIDRFPSCAIQAQIVLNKILTIITQMSDREID